MKILQVGAGDFFSTYGGGQVYVKNLVDAMIDEGAEVAVISFVGSAAEPIEKDYRSIRLIEVPTTVSEELLKKTICRIVPDVIHVHSMKHVVCRIGRQLNIPVVVTSHHGGILCPAGTRLNCKDEICHRPVNHKDCLPCVLRNTRTGLRWWYPFMKHLSEKTYLTLGAFLKNKPFVPFVTPIGSAALSIKGKQEQWREIAASCSVMIAPCREIAEAMIANGFDKDKINIITHGIPLPAERPPYPEVKDGKVKFYYVGRICYVKGLHTLLKAFSQVGNPHIELHLIGGAGNKQERRYMQQLQKRHRDDKRIVWHGKIAPKTVFEATRSYHVSSSSAFLEAFGLNIAEALALGKPVLATRSGGGEMQIKDGVNGWLVPTNDAVAMAERIEWIAEHPEVLPAMSIRCSAKSMPQHVDELMKIYSSVLES